MSADRQAVMSLVEQRVANEHLRRHMLACEAIMRALAVRFGEDEDAWGVAGLGHDLDAEETEDDFTRHGVIAGEALASPRRRRRRRARRRRAQRRAHGSERRSRGWTSLSSSPTSSAA